MNKIGLVITINKFKHYFETSQITLLCDSIDEAKDKLIEYLSKEFCALNIDYPLDLADFEYHWFNQQYVNSDAFYYKLFIEGSWREPWEYQDVYSDVLDKMQLDEEAEPPNFEEIYGEPNPDEDTNDNFSMENNEHIHEFEKKLTEIIKQAKTVNFKEDQIKEDQIKEDQIKECKCDKCKETQSELTSDKKLTGDIKV
jgi:hypothetical protein